MAFVPDKALERSSTLSFSAYRLYEYYCRWRDHSTGLSRKSFEDACLSLEKFPRATAYRAQKDLLIKHWIEVTPEGKIRPLMGSFAPVDRVETVEARQPRTGGSETRNGSLKNETGAVGESRQRDENSQKRDSLNKRNIQQGPAELNDDVVESGRARGDQQKQQQQIDDEFLNHLQGLRIYQKRGINVRDVLEKLMSTKGLTREQVTRSHLRGWCDRERPSHQAYGGIGDEANGRSQTGSRRDHEETGSRRPSRENRNLKELREQSQRVTFTATETTERAPDTGTGRSS